MKSVLDYGAKGDGVTDDTVAFNQAISGANIVFVPYSIDGYKIAGTILLFSNNSLIGESGTKLIHSGANDLFNLRGSFIEVRNFNIDSTTATGKDIVLKTDISTVSDVNIDNITGLLSKGLILDKGTNIPTRINISNIRNNSASGNTINLANINQGSISGIMINYTNSTAPDNAAISIGGTGVFVGGTLINKVDVIGSNTQTAPNQHGIAVTAVGEHTTITNCNIMYMGGVGILLQNVINFRLGDLDVSFCTGNQIECDTCSFSTISNVMARGRANGALSFLNSNYCLVLANSGKITVTGCDFKSGGSGVWHNNSETIVYSGCNLTTNSSYGIVSSNTASTSICIGCQFNGNGVADVLQSGAQQYTISAFKSNSTIGSLTGIGIM